MHPVVENLLVQDMETIVARLMPLVAQLFLWLSVAVLATILVAALAAVVNAVRRLRGDRDAHTAGSTFAFGSHIRGTRPAGRPAIRIVPLHGASRAVNVARID
jgi:hypothetical protein